MMNVTFDDRDSTFIYSDGWFRAGTYNATSVHDTGTLSSSSITNVSVTFVFPTPATAFYYYGIKRCCGGSYLICVDCDPNNRQFVTINAVDPTDGGQNPPVVLYSQQFSQAGVHEVILQNQPDPAFNGNSQITLDRFELTVPDPGSPQSSPSTSNSLSSPISSATTLLSPAGALVDHSSSSALILPIVGGVLGGLFILLLLVVIWILLRRRRRRLDSDKDEHLPGMVESQLQMPRRADTWTTFTATTTISSTESRRELDAGRVVNYLSAEETLLPPAYGQVFDPANGSPQSRNLPPVPSPSVASSKTGS
ncbi:hypothetical protein C8J57DRAFT_646526 [Mycena rebaudengoi]|nr:hypothetical protein C8J57DRAFT_646526 [Mycena rebaudengoi]